MERIIQYGQQDNAINFSLFYVNILCKYIIYLFMSSSPVPIIKIKKTDILWKYSNPNTSQKKSNKYLGKKRGRLFRSTNKNKKYMIYDDIHNKYVSFGQIKYEDYTKHKNKKRRKNYLTRSSKIKGEWKNNPFSPNNLSRKILW
jgi:hypothetical protein